MSRNDVNMEDLFRTQMESYTVDPSPEMWRKVHNKMLWKQFLSFSFDTLNVYYLAAVLSIAGIGTFALLSESGKPDQEQKALILTEKDSDLPLSISSDPEIAELETGEGTISADPRTEMQPKDEQQGKVKSKVPLDVTAESGQISRPEKDQHNKKSSTISPESGAAELSGENPEMLVAKALFTASKLSGCSPLAVNFENLSVNAIQNNWIFSDGGSSTEKNPSYVFDVPGEYRVVLKVMGKDGVEYTTEQIISVFETPKALFEMDETANLSNMQAIYFYNYSRDADYYEWGFGDGQGSNLTEPTHYYDRPGSYNVSLKVWTEKHCYDSLIIMNAFTGPESSIQFPNAFTPNMTGPAGGSYEVNDITNTIFHPHISGDLIEYQLKIFNRQGVQIFESSDASFGWDGYYQEKLGAQDVYIWKVRGKFSNGKTFVKSGDVTLIRRY